MTEGDAVDVVNNAAFVAFWVLLFVGTTSTLGRYAYYRAHGFRRPRLLIRDAFMVGGFAISFGLILFRRVLRARMAEDDDTPPKAPCGCPMCNRAYAKGHR